MVKTVKLSDSQLIKLKYVIKNQSGVMLRIRMKKFGGDKLPQDLY